MASSSSPCAACKFLRRKCTQECVFAPYFPPDQPQKFSYVHKVFGASNVAKLLNELASNQREDAVNSLYYEAEARLRDPVYGCVGLISVLQHRLKQLQHDLDIAKKELATYVGPLAMLRILQPPTPHFISLPPQPQRPSSSSSSASVLSTHHHHHHHQHQHDMLPMMAIPTGQSFMRDHQQQIFEAQQLAAVAREQQNEMFRAYGGASTSPHHQNQPQVEFFRFNNGLDSVPTGSVTVTGFNQLSSGDTNVTGMSPSLALGGNFVDSPATNNNYHEAQLFIPTQSSQPPPLQKKDTQTQTQSNSERGEGRRSANLGN